MRFVIIMVFLLMSAYPIYASMALSMEDAELLFLENNFEVKSKKIELQRSDALILDTKVQPNPAVRYSLESLQNGERETEETYSVIQSVDISGRRGRLIEAAHKSKEARSLLIVHEMSGLIVRMKLSFYKILFLKENQKALLEISGIISDIESKTEARVIDGDASEADLMKLRVEKNKIVRELEAIRTDLNSEKSKLALFLNIDSIDFDLVGELTYRPSNEGNEKLTDPGQLNRPDIKGQEKRVEVSALELSASTKGTIQPLDLEAGYKKRTGGFNGFVFGITVPLPLFNRNQGAIALAEAELAQEKVILEAVKKNAVYEVNILLERTASLRTRIVDLLLQVETSKRLTRIAGVAYEEGETGLLELLDAARSEKEIVMEKNTTVYDYWAARFELDKAVGTGITALGGTK